MLKNTIAAFVLAVTAAAATVTPALGGDGVVYKQTKHWIVMAYPQDIRCIAHTAYPRTGDQILFGIDTKGWFLSLASRSANMTAGNQYKVSVVTSLGSSGTYIGRAIGKDQIMIDSLTNADLYGWAKAKSINIVGMGVYNLKGSLDAIVSLKSCGDMIVAMQDAGVPQASAPQQNEPAAGVQVPNVTRPAPEPRQTTPQPPHDNLVEAIEL
ncbi:hypothetical protein IB244_26025 [Rhizobium sp. RHZ02]|uniref:hypothetical protein n=1 Tax=Rhizobium sp. RHZ02 TaxID=2769306 RepID=UPI001787745D|nr:hypothetical protein [Rhizobium sp. RHZ02]MBD9454946.1 hypothetical protein [Rhizobium sp. RHZ02]